MFDNRDGSEFNLSKFVLTAGSGSVYESNFSVGRRYNLRGWVNDVNYADQWNVGYEYDSRGMRTKLIYPDDSNVTYEYDALSRLSKVKYQGSTIARAW